jgi:uncharacterized protein (DUF305 family)
VAAFCLAVSVVASVASCSDQAADPQPEADHGAGHAEDTPGASDPGTHQEGWNDADAAFLEGMIPHHQQALEMAELARTRAESPDVLALAERIAAAQGPEILVMADWLVDHGREVPDRAHHEPGALHGMLSDDQMAELAQADGAAFDELFLTGMVQHHEGAVEMALVALSDGEDQRVSELANDVNATQAAEIARMGALLSSR